jgi:hypothetical protein
MGIRFHTFSIAALVGFCSSAIADDIQILPSIRFRTEWSRNFMDDFFQNTWFFTALGSLTDLGIAQPLLRFYYVLKIAEKMG